MLETNVLQALLRKSANWCETGRIWNCGGESDRSGRHSRIYTDPIPIMEDVITRCMKDVANRDYPAEKETIFMVPDECPAFAQEMKWDRKVDELRSVTKKTA